MHQDQMMIDEPLIQLFGIKVMMNFGIVQNDLLNQEVVTTLWLPIHFITFRSVDQQQLNNVQMPNDLAYERLDFYQLSSRRR